MTPQRFTLTDIQRSQIGDSVFAAATLTPAATPAVPGGMVYPGQTNNPSPVRLTGLPAAEAADWNVGDVFTLVVTKVTA